MVKIKELLISDIENAVEIKYNCWLVDYAHIISVNQDFKEFQSKEIIEWISERTGDIRKLFGIFNGNELQGFTGASFAEDFDCRNGIEVNYLFVNKNERSKGYGLMLLKEVLDYYSIYNPETVIIYNFEKAISNDFYKHLNAGLLRKEVQEIDDKKINVDVFYWDYNTLKFILNNKLSKYI